MPIRHIGRGRRVALPLLDSGEWVDSVTLQLLHPRRETRYPRYRRLYGPRGRSRWARKILSPPEFEARQDEIILLLVCMYSTPRIQLRPPIYTRIRKSFKVHFLKILPCCKYTLLPGTLKVSKTFLEAIF